MMDDLHWGQTSIQDIFYKNNCNKNPHLHLYMPLQSNEEQKNKALNKSLTQNMWLFFSLFFQVDYLGIKFNFVL